MKSKISTPELDFYKIDFNDQNQSTKELQICLVDDDPIINFVTRKTFEKNFRNIKIKEFNSASQALTQLSGANYCPDIILLDINMPEMDGFQFIDKLSSKLSGSTSVFMLSSSIDPKDRSMADERPAIKGFYSKPISVEQIEDLISASLNHN